MSFEFISSSDWHIGSLVNVFNDALAKQIVEVQKIYEYAMEHGIGYVIVPGDMTDTTMLKNSEIIALIRLFALYDNDIVTYYISGNHDYHSSNRSSVDVLQHLAKENLLKNLHIITEPTHVIIDNVHVNFVPYPHTERKYKKGNAINFVHMDTEGATDDNGYSAKVKKEFEYAKSDIVISGHIHKYQVLRNGRWIYCANPYQKKFDELSPKGFLHCLAEVADGVLDFEHKFIKSRPEFRLKTVRIKSVKDIEKLEQSNNVAYKLEPEEGVLLPSDIGTTFNIVDIKNKFVAPEASMTSNHTNLRTGLKHYLKSCNLTNEQIKSATNLVKEAILSYSLNSE